MPSCPVGHESAADDYCDQCGRRMGGAPATSSAAGGPASPGLAPSAEAGGQASGRPASGGAATGEAAAQPCPECGTPRSGRFCEVCRFDFVSGQPTAQHPGPERQAAAPAGGETAGQPAATPPAPSQGAASAEGATPLVPPDSAGGTAWSAVVTADRDYFDRVVAAAGPEAAAISFPPYCPERRFLLGMSRAGEEKQIGRRSASRGVDPAIDLTGPPADPGVSRLHAVLIGQADGGWAVLDPGSENGTLLNDKEIPIGVPVPLHDGDRVHLGAWTAITISRGNRP
jgi:hypothetical protein